MIVLYELIFLALSGQTPGQRLLGMRVIDSYGDAPSPLRAVVRVVSLWLSLVLFGLGCLWIAFSREKRGLHDLLAGTWVVLTARASASSASPASNARASRQLGAQLP